MIKIINANDVFAIRRVISTTNWEKCHNLFRIYIYLKYHHLDRQWKIMTTAALAIIIIVYLFCLIFAILSVVSTLVFLICNGLVFSQNNLVIVCLLYFTQSRLILFFIFFVVDFAWWPLQKKYFVSIFFIFCRIHITRMKWGIKIMYRLKSIVSCIIKFYFIFWKMEYKKV